MSCIKFGDPKPYTNVYLNLWKGQLVNILSQTGVKHCIYLSFDLEQETIFSFHNSTKKKNYISRKDQIEAQTKLSLQKQRTIQANPFFFFFFLSPGFVTVKGNQKNAETCFNRCVIKKNLALFTQYRSECLVKTQRSQKSAFLFLYLT